MKKNILILLIYIAIISCEKKDNDLLDKIDIYPIEIGNKWTYKFETTIINYSSESFDKIISFDTIVETRSVSVIKDTILNGSIKVKQIKTITDNLVSNYSYVNYSYVNIDSDGLKEYGFSSQEHIDNVYIHEIPKLEVKLPLEKNSYWINYSLQGIVEPQIEKEVIGSEVLKINNNNFLCFKIKKINKNLTGVQMFEWISKEGLIKSQEIYEKRSVQLRGYKLYFQITYTTTLNDLKLN